MVSFRGQKTLGPRQDRFPLGGLIQNFQLASPPFSYAESLPAGAVAAGSKRGLSFLKCKDGLIKGALLTLTFFNGIALTFRLFKGKKGEKYFFSL